MADSAPRAQFGPTEVNEPGMVEPHRLIGWIRVHCLAEQLKLLVPRFGLLFLCLLLGTPDFRKEFAAPMPCRKVTEIAFNLP